MTCEHCKYFQKGKEGIFDSCRKVAGKTFVVWEGRPSCDSFLEKEFKVEEHLKPCPLCGNQDLHYSRPTPYGTPGVWWAEISCKCGLSLSIGTRKEKEIIEKWNKRS